ncbi:GNAT family N-acetyltransferase [Pendulispora rubella]|uniref:GNAT family N-acetyltransferase n=1 Tax=Pendulispora rubella TaxID=2741070 RepID=A0ABZ2LGT4_9BACT
MASDAFAATTAPIRRLTLEDMPACFHLATDRDWPIEEKKWRLLFEIGAVYGIDDPAGGLAGMVVCTPYGREVSAIGMMVVARRHERRGLGGRLMRHAIEQAGTATTWLTATAFGQPLYAKLGFRVASEMTTYMGEIQPVPQGEPISRRATETDLPGILALDGAAFGAPRKELLTRLMGRAEVFRVIDSPGGITGFGASWRSTQTACLSPVVAEDMDAALGLFADLARDTPGRVRVDADHRFPRLRAWAEAHGLQNSFQTAVMIYGEPLPGDRARVFAPTMQALG